MIDKTKDVNAAANPNLRRSGRKRNQIHKSYTFDSYDKQLDEQMKSSDSSDGEEDTGPDFEFGRILSCRWEAAEQTWNFHCKIKNLSYKHLTWQTEADLDSHSKLAKIMMRRFKNMFRLTPGGRIDGRLLADGELFDAVDWEDFAKVDMILESKRVWLTIDPDAYLCGWGLANVDASHQPIQLPSADSEDSEKNPKVETVYEDLYMVKWRELAFSLATWERASDLNCPDKIKEFWV